MKLYSRRHSDFKKRFPPIADALAELKPTAILDGEIVALDEEAKPRFEWLVSRGPQRGALVYYVFDLLMLDGKDLREMLLLTRKVRLQRLIYVDHIEGRGLEMFAGALAVGLEGVVAKDSKSPYVEGPAVTGHGQKIKNSDYKRQGKVDGNLVGGKAVGRTVL